MIQKIVCGDNWPSVGSMMTDMFYVYDYTLFISLFHTIFSFEQCCLLTQKVNKDIDTL